MKRYLTTTALVLILIFAFGCASHANEDMYSMAPKLNKLVTAVQGYESFAKPDLSMDDQELMIKATEHDPGLLDQFQGYHVDLLRHEGYVSILICGQDGKKALLQDVGCTNAFDHHLWRETNSPCEQNITVFNICK